jgi:hypothetical protein
VHLCKLKRGYNIVVAAEPKNKRKQVRGHCPNCGPARFAEIVAEYVDREEIERDGVWAETTSRILQCGGCKSVYFQDIYIFSEDYDYDDGPDGQPILSHNERITYYPAPSKRKRPDWLTFLGLEHSLFDLLVETYNALDVDACVLAAVGARTVFDRASQLLKVDSSLTFKQKLDLLHQLGHIGASEREHLDLLTGAGGAAAHRGWKPTTAQLNTVMSIVEALIYRTFVLDREVKKLKKQIPARRKRKKKDRATILARKDLAG